MADRTGLSPASTGAAAGVEEVQGGAEVAGLSPARRWGGAAAVEAEEEEILMLHDKVMIYYIECILLLKNLFLVLKKQSNFVKM